VDNSFRNVRVFISSTFEDLVAEREELLKRAFPRLRKWCTQRQVALTAVDLRWGITEEQAQQGEVLPRCLAEIDRCRPFFVCLVGKRYGSVLGPRDFNVDLLARYPWLRQHIGESITEIEISYGALNGPAAPQNLFYFREGCLTNGSDTGRLDNLKKRIREGGGRLVRVYHEPAEVGKLVAADLQTAIEGMFPGGEEPDPLDREAAEHEAFGRSRRRIYLGRQDYFRQIDEFADRQDGGKGLLVVGEAGSGKSALLAAWLERRKNAHPQNLHLYHVLASTPDGADGAKMLRRFLGEFRRLGVEIEIPETVEGIQAAFLAGLYQVAREPIVIALDGLDQLEERDGFRDLLWLPDILPGRARIVASSLPGQPLDILRRREWQLLRVEPLTTGERRALVVEVLREAGKSLNESLLARLAQALPCANPLFLRTVLEELCLFGVHERLDERIAWYLAPGTSPSGIPTIEDLFARVLTRYEEDYERERPGLVRDAMSLLWASRRGLQEQELVEMLGSGKDQPLPQVHWSPLFIAAENTLLYQTNRINFLHDFVRRVVQNRYLPTEEQRLDRHRTIADYFDGSDFIVRVRVGDRELPHELVRFTEWSEARVTNPRRLEESPWQLAKSREWFRLAQTLAEAEVLEFWWKENRTDLEVYWTMLYENSPWRLIHAYQEIFADPPKHLKSVDAILWLLNSMGETSAKMKLNEKLIDHYREQRSDGDLARHLHILATQLRKGGDLRGSIARYEEEEKIYRELGDSKGLGFALDGMALAFRRLGEWDKALAANREAEELGRCFNIPMLVASSLNNRTLLMRERGASHEELADTYAEVERLARQVNEPWLLSQSLFFLAQQRIAPLATRPKHSDGDLRYTLHSIFPLLREASRIAAVCRFDTLAEKVRPSLESIEKVVRTLAQRLTAQGVGLFQRDEIEQALALYKEAEEVYTQLGDLEGVGIAISEQSVVFLRRDDLDTALTYMRREEQICRDMKDLPGLATCLSNQTTALLELDDVDGASKLLDKQEEETGSLTDPSIRGRCLALRASVLRRRADAEGALAKLVEAEAFFRRAADAEGLATVLLISADLLTNDLRRGGDASKAAREALHLASEKGLEVLRRSAEGFLTDSKTPH
jgi:tetratricopeptide (TPR) repeat protein